MADGREQADLRAAGSARRGDGAADDEVVRARRDRRVEQRGRERSRAEHGDGDRKSQPSAVGPERGQRERRPLAVVGEPPPRVQPGRDRGQRQACDRDAHGQAGASTGAPAARPRRAGSRSSTGPAGCRPRAIEIRAPCEREPGKRAACSHQEQGKAHPPQFMLAVVRRLRRDGATPRDERRTPRRPPRPRGCGANVPRPPGSGARCAGASARWR